MLATALIISPSASVSASSSASADQLPCIGHLSKLSSYL
jgi:hypothetical protein